MAFCRSGHSHWAGNNPLVRMLSLASCAQGVVKRFFNEKEVTSTLVMDALVSGVKQIEECSRLGESKKVSPPSVQEAGAGLCSPRVSTRHCDPTWTARHRDARCCAC